MSNWDLDFAPRISEMLSDNREEQNQNLEEMERSVTEYLKTGIKSSNLQEFEQKEVEFRHLYAAIVGSHASLYRKIQEEVLAIMDRKVEQELPDFSVEYSKICKDPMKAFTNFGRSLLENALCLQIEKMDVQIKNLSEQIAYMGRMSELYQLYCQEQIIRERERKFQEDLEAYEALESMVQFCSMNKRVRFSRLLESLSFPEQSIEHTLKQCSDYFSENVFHEVRNVALNVKGRQLDRYLRSEKMVCHNESLYRLFETFLDRFQMALEFEMHDIGFREIFDIKYLTASQRSSLNRKFTSIVNQSRFTKEMYDIIEMDDTEFTILAFDSVSDREEEKNGRGQYTFHL